MGHLASYAIRRYGEVRLFYSHWGALFVPEDLFWGPSFAERFIERNETASDWVDDVFGEGGAALDFDQKRCALFGGDRLGYGAIQDLTLALMRVVWAEAGWSIDTVESMCGVAECVGVPADRVRAPMLEPRALGPDLARRHVEGGYFVTLVTRRVGTSVDDRVVGVGPGEVLAAGPELLEWWDALVPLSDAVVLHAERVPKRPWERGLGQEISDGVAIDEAARQITLSFGARTFPDARLMDWLRERWDGWTLIRHDDGLEGHFLRASREPPGHLGSVEDSGAEAAAARAREAQEETRDELLDQIAEVLFGDRTDPAALARRAIANDDGERDPAVTPTHPSLFVSPPDGRPSPETAQAIFQLALNGLETAPGE